MEENNDSNVITPPALVIVARVKAINKSAGLSTSAEYLIALNREIQRLLEKGQRCAAANGRKTLKAQDL